MGYEKHDIQWAINELVRGFEVRRKAWPSVIRRMYTQSGALMLAENPPIRRSRHPSSETPVSNFWPKSIVFPLAIEDLIATDWETYEESKVSDAMDKEEMAIDGIKERITDLEKALRVEENHLAYVKRCYTQTYLGRG